MRSRRKRLARLRRKYSADEYAWRVHGTIWSPQYPPELWYKAPYHRAVVEAAGMPLNTAREFLAALNTHFPDFAASMRDNIMTITQSIDVIADA